MRISNTVTVLVLSLSTPTHAIRANSVIINSPPEAPSFSHGGYVAQMVESSHEPFFMHEQWHNRHVEVAVANETTAIISPAGHVNNTGLDNFAGTANDIVPALAMTDLTTDTEDWEELTEHLCKTALSDAHDIATNPSGIESCYNILTFDIASGTFDADLRIFQISLAREGWQDMKSDSLSLGLNYEHAEVSERTSDDHANVKGSMNEGQQDWRQDHERANDWLRLGSNRMEPKRVAILKLTGTMNEGGRLKLSTEEAAKDILTPQIRISAMDANDKQLSVNLGMQAAWFINGVFAQQVNNQTMTKMDEWTAVIDIEAMLARGSKLEGTQLIPIIVACVWAVLMSLPWAYGLWMRMKMQREYRSKMKQGYSLNVTVISWG